VSDEIVAIDLFCGAGGFSEGLRQACDDLDLDLRSIAINHWDRAVETHERNHDYAEQYHSKIQQFEPPNVVADLHDADPTDHDPKVDILVAGPECTHFSKARGGRPVKEQKRASCYDVLEWLDKLNVQQFVIENVEEIVDWGPTDEDNRPTRDGSVFDAWVGFMNALGYAVNWTVLNAADYGVPQSRDRFFIVGTKTGGATFPAPTHAETPAPGSDRDPWLTAADIIDWSNLGTSVWTRDLTEDLIHTPLKQKTMKRIAEGLRRHCADWVTPYADAVASIGRDEVRHLREERVVALKDAPAAAAALDDPFLVPRPSTPLTGHPYLTKYKNTSPPKPVDDPLDTVQADGNHYALTLPEPFVFGQQSNAIARRPAARPAPTVATRGNIHFCTAETMLLRQGKGAHPIDVTERGVPTIPTKGAHSIATATADPLVMPRDGVYGGPYSNGLYGPADRPMHVVTARNHDGHLLTPSLVRYSHGGATLDVDDPMPTVATERGGVFAMAAPYLTPMYNGRGGQRPRTRSLERPLMTVVASKPSPAGLASPFLVDYHGQSVARAVDRPLGTVETKDRYALVVPDLWPWGLDIKFRMLQPDELKQAQGFPADYDIAGNKEEVTKQIGNAVPVGLAKALCKHLLSKSDPDLSTYGGGLSEQAETDIPPYEEVVGDD
jgi:DNA (cytosine-5)-methyltransferase 1